MALVDISRSIAPATAVWPGDQKVEWSWTARVGAQEEGSVNLGALRHSTHVASHADAPLHVDPQGKAVDALPLSAFVGPAEVVDVDDASRIRPEHVVNTTAERVLFKTSASALSDDEWPGRIAAVAPDTVRFLADQDVRLIGTDAPSVDPLDSTDLPAHHALIDTGIVNVEGLRFENVPPGRYILIALPLKISGGDAAPVRAVLRDASARQRPG
jgi:arylformamidase